MTDKIKLVFILVGIFSSVTTYACSQLAEISERLACQKALEESSKSRMLETYSDLYDYLADINEYQTQIALSQKLWTETTVQNCNVYAYFAEEESVTHEVTMSECMTE
tara:strand:- start:819 stop:1142 length:324 start_codon:yes stop_codon:yes gene_type:complete